jgi:hypothetical protein
MAHGNWLPTVTPTSLGGAGYHISSAARFYEVVNLDVISWLWITLQTMAISEAQLKQRREAPLKHGAKSGTALVPLARNVKQSVLKRM